MMQRLWLVKQLFFNFTKVVFFDVKALGGDAILFHIVVAAIRIFFFEHLVDIVIDRISTSRRACECAFTPTVLLEKLVKLSQVRYPQLASIRLLFHRRLVPKLISNYLAIRRKLCLLKLKIFRIVLIKASHRLELRMHIRSSGLQILTSIVSISLLNMLLLMRD